VRGSRPADNEARRRVLVPRRPRSRHPLPIALYPTLSPSVQTPNRSRHSAQARPTWSPDLTLDIDLEIRNPHCVAVAYLSSIIGWLPAGPQPQRNTAGAHRLGVPDRRAGAVVDGAIRRIVPLLALCGDEVRVRGRARRGRSRQACAQGRAAVSSLLRSTHRYRDRAVKPQVPAARQATPHLVSTLPAGHGRRRERDGKGGRRAVRRHIDDGGHAVGVVVGGTADHLPGARRHERYVQRVHRARLQLRGLPACALPARRATRQAHACRAWRARKRTCAA